MDVTHSSDPEDLKDLESRLTPGAAIEVYEFIRKTGPAERRYRLFQVLSRISSAIRARDEDQSRSAVRSETDKASAVSATVKPAK